MIKIFAIIYVSYFFTNVISNIIIILLMNFKFEFMDIIPNIFYENNNNIYLMKYNYYLYANILYISYFYFFIFLCLCLLFNADISFDGVKEPSYFIMFTSLMLFGFIIYDNFNLSFDGIEHNDKDFLRGYLFVIFVPTSFLTVFGAIVVLVMKIMILIRKLLGSDRKV